MNYGTGNNILDIHEKYYSNIPEMTCPDCNKGTKKFFSLHDLFGELRLYRKELLFRNIRPSFEEWISITRDWWKNGRQCDTCGGCGSL